jgi:hypothetical protein
MEEKTFRSISQDVMDARRYNVKLNYTPEEIATDLLTTAKVLIIDLEKFLSLGMQEPAKRVRFNTKIMETLGKSFRIQSINAMHEHKKSKSPTK